MKEQMGLSVLKKDAVARDGAWPHSSPRPPIAGPHASVAVGFRRAPLTRNRSRGCKTNRYVPRTRTWSDGRSNISRGCFAWAQNLLDLLTCEVNDVIASIASDSAISMSHLDFRLLSSDFT